ncbi:MAG: DMT family transporter [Chloroflexaceae bacterium]|nr:DMT family transporter [Chloroflexaceae bacterium]
MQRHTLLPYLILFGGVSIVSSAPILIRLAQTGQMPSLTIAAGRLVLAALILTPLALLRAGREIRQMKRNHVLFALASGAFLAAHIAVWITSLEYTSVASSTILVTTNPIWVGIASYILFRERLTSLTITGIAITFAGGLLVILSDATSSPHSNPLLGNILALFGAFGASAYFLAGRALRRQLSILPYIWVVYTTAASILVLLVLLTGQLPAVYTTQAVLALLALALGPQLLGHTALNWSLGYLSATFVTIAILGEPIGSAILAWFLFDERFTATTIYGYDLPLQLLGFIVLLSGIAMAALGEEQQRTRVQQRLIAQAQQETI